MSLCHMIICYITYDHVDHESVQIIETHSQNSKKRRTTRPETDCWYESAVGGVLDKMKTRLPAQSQNLKKRGGQGAVGLPN